MGHGDRIHQPARAQRTAHRRRGCGHRGSWRPCVAATAPPSSRAPPATEAGQSAMATSVAGAAPVTNEARRTSASASAATSRATWQRFARTRPKLRTPDEAARGPSIFPRCWCVVIPTRLSMHVAMSKTVTETVTSARAHAAAARLCLAFSPQQTNSNTPFAPSPPTRLSARVAAPDTTRARQGPHRCRRNRL